VLRTADEQEIAPMMTSVQPGFFIRQGCIASADNVVQAMRYTAETCAALHHWTGICHSSGECEYAFSTGIGCELSVLNNELRVRPGDVVARNAATGRYSVYRDDNFAFFYAPLPDFTFDMPPVHQQRFA
jgi:hypothetical protein